MTKKSVQLALILATLALASACTKKSEAPAPEASPAAAAAAAPAADPNAKADVELNIGSKGDEMAFDVTELTVKAGQMVKLTFKNNTKSSGMQHNWVLVKAGSETEVANAGMQASEANNWVAEGPNVIAHTALAKNPGDTVSVVFKAPEAGSYPYICTFPGHSVVMKGVLKVQ